MLTDTQARWRLGVIIIIYLMFGVVNSIWLPLHKAPDEIAHFQYIRFIARHRRLPINYQERDEAGYRSDWPAFYHILTATLTGWADSNDPPHLKFVWESPRFDLARELLDTKRLANTEDEYPPYRGGVLMWHIGRLVSLLFSTGTIVVTFLITLEVFPRHYRIALFSAALVAFIPTYIFISSVLSDDSLMGLVAGLYIWVLIRIFKNHTRWLNFVLLGMLMGLSAATKYSAVILPLEVVAVVSYLAWRARWGLWLWTRRLTVVALAAIAASSWWYIFLMIYFNEIAQYGLLVGLFKPIIAGGVDRSQRYAAYVLTGGQIGLSDSPEFISEPFWAWVLETYRSFWAIKIGTYPLSPLAFLLVGGILLLTMFGLIRLWRQQLTTRPWIGLILFHLLAFLIFPLVRYLILRDLAQSAQGRHLLFPIATVFPLLVAFGWQGLGQRWRRWLPGVTLAGLLAWNVAQTTRIVTYYDSVHTLLPVKTTADATQSITHPVNQTFGANLQLLGYDLNVAPGDGALYLSLFWQSPSYPAEDYRRQLRLVRNGETVLDWLSYPTNARYPSRIWEEGETIRDDVALPLIGLPSGAYQLQLQLWDAHRPLPVAGDGDTVTLGTVTVPPDLSLAANLPLTLNLDGRAVIERVNLWQAERYTQLDLPKFLPRMVIPLVWVGQLAPDERLNWLLVDDQGQVYPAQTAATNVALFAVAPNWPTGTYRLRAEVWRDDAVVASQQTSPILTVFNEKPRQVQPPPIGQPVAVDFRDEVTLVGYNLPTRRLSPGQGVPLTLVWQGLRTMDRSYTVFTKLLDKNQQVWGQTERLPADGYNTIYWLENEVVVDSFELSVNPAIPNGVYWLNVGLYEVVNGQAESLPLTQNNQPTGETSITFGPLKYGGPPPGVTVTQANPQTLTNTIFGNQIKLLGFDLGHSNPKAQNLNLTLYWESLAPIATNYTVFVHVQDEAGNVVAQMDRPPTNDVYPTSVWSAGEIILDEMPLPLPVDLPAGTYTMVAGLYDFATGQRLPVPDSADNSLYLTLITLPLEQQ